MSAGKTGIETRVKEHRLRAGLTQEELARRVGVRRETIVFLERAAYNPSLKLALLIARELDAPIAELFSLEKPSKG